MGQSEPTNDNIADVLNEIAELLEAKDANPFRVQSYRDGASTVRNLDEPVAELVEREGSDALKRLPDIGEGLSRLISEYVETGRSELLERLREEVTPQQVFGRVPGIGDDLAQRIADELKMHTLEELEEAAHDGRLARIEGFGPKRLAAVKTSLAGMLSQSASSQNNERGQQGDEGEAERPSVRLLLTIDEEYRQRAEAGQLKKIAPKRFNTEGEAWLPIMETESEGWKFTVLFSNTARAHELGTTDDWVVIYYERDGQERQNTVVTETSGPLKGQRVVRGRSAETRRYYEERRP